MSSFRRNHIPVICEVSPPVDIMSRVNRRFRRLAQIGDGFATVWKGLCGAPWRSRAKRNRKAGSHPSVSDLCGLCAPCGKNGSSSAQKTQEHRGPTPASIPLPTPVNAHNPLASPFPHDYPLHMRHFTVLCRTLP